jgi:hypothetical protein
LGTGETIYAFRTEGVMKIIRKLDAASQMARALERCLPALIGLGNRGDAEAGALRALAIWEEACRQDVKLSFMAPRAES